MTSPLIVCIVVATIGIKFRKSTWFFVRKLVDVSIDRFLLKFLIVGILVFYFAYSAHICFPISVNRSFVKIKVKFSVSQI